MKEKFYLTTSIVYTNAAPHLGFAYELVLADIIARYKRSQGIDTYFLTGTDEHGAKIAKAAEKEGLSTKAFVNENTKHVKALIKSLGVSNDGFIRTSDKLCHWPGAIKLWKKIAAKGDLYKKKYKGLYCMGDEAFHGENTLLCGECPNYPGQALEVVEEENYFFKLGNYTSEIKKRITSGELKIIPASRGKEIISLLDEGLSDVSFSRLEGAIPWGIPVPGDFSQMMYVWCDALSNYVSALGYGSSDKKMFKKYWPADLHLIGKDILRFHAAIWPAMLISAGLPLPKSIMVHGFITSDGKKMSKSLGNVIDPMALINEFGKDAFRHYFSSEMSPYEDGDFSREKFIENYNGNLANGLGNLVSRVLKMSSLYFGGIVKGNTCDLAPLQDHMKTVSGEVLRELGSIENFINSKIFPEYQRAMEVYEIHKASNAIWRLIKTLDLYVSGYEPFKLIKTNREKTEGVIFNLLFGLEKISEMLLPFLPDTALKITELIGRVGKGNMEYRTSILDTPLFPRKD
ncbi:MAG: methionine--tRNA ligase [Patescibacteria group bacterium]